MEDIGSQKYCIYTVRHMGIQEFPYLDPCSKGGDVQQNKLLASRQFTRPKSVHATTLENDRCKRA
jgi:hypothetical protein